MFKICIKISECWFNTDLTDLAREEEQMGSITGELQKVRHVFHSFIEMGLGVPNAVFAPQNCHNSHIN